MQDREGYREVMTMFEPCQKTQIKLFHRDTMREHVYSGWSILFPEQPYPRAYMGYDGEIDAATGRYEVYFELIQEETVPQEHNAPAHPDALRIDKNFELAFDRVTSLYQVTFIMESNTAEHKSHLEEWVDKLAATASLKWFLTDLFTKARDTERAAHALTGSTHRGTNPSQKTDNSLGGTSGTNPPSTNTDGTK